MKQNKTIVEAILIFLYCSQYYKNIWVIIVQGLSVESY